jgi:hypothetical protein
MLASLARCIIPPHKSTGYFYFSSGNVRSIRHPGTMGRAASLPPRKGVVFF